MSMTLKIPVAVWNSYGCMSQINKEEQLDLKSEFASKHTEKTADKEVSAVM